jgi:hypothetical protein
MSRCSTSVVKGVSMQRTLKKLNKHKENNTCNISFQGYCDDMETVQAVTEFTFFCVNSWSQAHDGGGGGRTTTTDGTRKCQKHGLVGRKVDKLECIELVERLVEKITYGDKTVRWKVSCR